MSYDIKRYDVYACHGMELDYEEEDDGKWVKYQDIKHILDFYFEAKRKERENKIKKTK